MFLLTFRLPQQILALKPFQIARLKMDQWFTRRATRAFLEAAKRPVHLSEESVFNARLRRLEASLEQVRRIDARASLKAR